MIYIATSYSGKGFHREIFEERRYEEALAILRWHLVTQKVTAFSPIVHCHELAKRYGLPKDAEFWKHHNQGWLEYCRVARFFLLEGAFESTGLAMEWQMSHDLNETSELWTVKFDKFYPKSFLKVKRIACRDNAKTGFTPWQDTLKKLKAHGISGFGVRSTS